MVVQMSEMQKADKKWVGTSRNRSLTSHPYRKVPVYIGTSFCHSYSCSFGAATESKICLLWGSDRPCNHGWSAIDKCVGWGSVSVAPIWLFIWVKILCFITGTVTRAYMTPCYYIVQLYISAIYSIHLIYHLPYHPIQKNHQKVSDWPMWHWRMPSVDEHMLSVLISQPYLETEHTVPFLINQCKFPRNLGNCFARGPRIIHCKFLPSPQNCRSHTPLIFNLDRT